MQLMRAVLLSVLGVAVAAQGALLGAAPASAAPPVAGSSGRVFTTIQAVPADSVVDSYGVGIHLNYDNTPYADEQAVATALDELGVRHVRDDLYLDRPTQYAAISTVAQRGIAFDLIMGRPGVGTPEEYVDTVATQLPAGSVESLEGANEWDLVGPDDPADWVPQVKAWQEQLYTAAKADPATADLPVLSPALAFKQNYAAAGDLSANADLANAHMYPGGYRPSNQIKQMTEALRASVPGKPLVTTEAGYHNALGSDSGHRPVPEDVAGTYLPRLLLEHVLRGEQRVYSYELIDEFDDPDLTSSEANFGLLRHDLTPKPAYTAMQNLLGLLADPGPSFDAGSLAVEATGLPAGEARYVLTQKRDGRFVLLLWRDVSVWDPVGQTTVDVAPADVTLRFGESKDLALFRPSDSAAAERQTTSDSLSLQLGGEVVAIAIGPPSVPATVPLPPRVLSAKAGKRSVTVTWAKADGRGSAVTGYRLTYRGKTLDVGAGKLRATLSGLPAGKRLRIGIRARNGVGWSAIAYTKYVTTRR